MNKNITLNNELKLNIDEALHFNSRLHYEISRALKLDDGRTHIRVDICETSQKVMLFVPLEFTFRGEKITGLQATLCSTDAFKWQYDEEVSDDDVAQFSVSFTDFNECPPKEYDEFDLHLCAALIVPHIENDKELSRDFFHNLKKEIEYLVSMLEPDCNSLTELESKTESLEEIKEQLEALAY